MEPDSERFVPKVHPTARGVEPDDPYDLNAELVPGDADELFRSVVQEYAMFGWSAESIWGLFRDPFYPMLNRILKALGDEEVRIRIDALLAKTGITHFRATVVEGEPDPEADPDVVPEGPPVVSIGIPSALLKPRDPSPDSFVSLESLKQGSNRGEGNSYAEGS
ncbi:MAG: hypothetical protein ABI353_14490 [Isosphaeraceae bacterium]